MTDTDRPLRVLILCTANSARSQMAEGLLRSLAGPRLYIRSAGARPNTTFPRGIHPLAVKAMSARGIDIREQRSQSLEGFLDEPWDHVLTVCDTAAESCPAFPGPARRSHWSIPDPAAASGSEAERLAAFGAARDELERVLREWLIELSD